MVGRREKIMFGDEAGERRGGRGRSLWGGEEGEEDKEEGVMCMWGWGKRGVNVLGEVRGRESDREGKGKGKGKKW